MSIPRACAPQRMPNPLVTGPFHWPDEAGCRGGGVPGRRIGVARLGRLDSGRQATRWLARAPRPRAGTPSCSRPRSGGFPASTRARRRDGSRSRGGRPSAPAPGPREGRSSSSRQPRSGRKSFVCCRCRRTRCLAVPTGRRCACPAPRSRGFHVVGLRDQVGEGQQYVEPVDDNNKASSGAPPPGSKKKKKKKKLLNSKTSALELLLEDLHRLLGVDRP